MVICFCSGCFHHPLVDQADDAQAEDMRADKEICYCYNKEPKAATQEAYGNLNNAVYDRDYSQTGNPIEIATTYYNSAYNFFIDIPVLWKDVYEIAEEKKDTVVYCIICDDIRVVMFTVRAWTHEEFEDLLEVLNLDYSSDYTKEFIKNDVIGKNSYHVFTIIHEITLDAYIESEECMEEWFSLALTHREMKDLIRIDKQQ